MLASLCSHQLAICPDALSPTPSALLPPLPCPLCTALCNPSPAGVAVTRRAGAAAGGAGRRGRVGGRGGARHVTPGGSERHGRGRER